METRNRGRPSQRGFCLWPGQQRGGGGAGFGAGYAGCGRTGPAGGNCRPAAHIMGAGPRLGQIDRAALSPRIARRPAPPDHPCGRGKGGGPAVRAGRRRAMPRSRLCHRRSCRQSQGAEFHCFAPVKPGGRAARGPAVAGTAERRSRPVLCQDALGCARRAVLAPALECRCARPAGVAGRIVPRTNAPTGGVDIAPRSNRTFRPETNRNSS